MIVRLQKPGGSFIGAGKYHLHDKLDGQQMEAAKSGERVSTRGQSDERVWFTDTRNCLNTDPERALEEMWHTADSQAWLKQQAGVKRGGRVCEDPVQTLSLSWHKDDKPTPEHMIEAADSYLKHMGWDQHQAVYIAHRDTDHPHLHITLNRVHPETGRTLDNYRDQPRSQEWALAYEREHEQVRCEQREVNAAKREGRTVAAERVETGIPQPATEVQPEPVQRAPANDHLPHNVIMIGRPHEKAFNEREQARADLDAKEREQLKAEQRAEREAFFKDGAKLFKAIRHAVYDEVRKEYKAEWRDLYKDAKEGRATAQEHSEAALTRAFGLSAAGRQDDARAAFMERDSVRDAVATQLAERKADLKSRQTEDLRERQKDACDALRETRDVQYHDLLQRQRDERAAFNAGQTLDNIRLGQGAERTIEPAAIGRNDAPANENLAADVARGIEGQTVSSSTLTVIPELVPTPRPIAEYDKAIQSVALPAERTELPAPEPANVVMPTADAPEVTRQIADLAAGGIGQVASYLADQLGEMFAPTPPEVREAQAKAAAKAEAEKPAPIEHNNPYARQIDAAMKIVEVEREQREQNRAYWEERDKGKDFERDR